MAKLRVKKIKSHIGTTPNQKKTLVALGLKKMNSSRVHDDSKVLQGMIDRVRHLVEVSEVKQPESK